MQTNFSAVIPGNIPVNETIVLPISMSQPLERGERLAAIINSIRAHHYEDRTTILVCDYLNRHNCETDAKALEQGDQFLKEHHHMLNGLHIVRWQDFLATRNQEVFANRFSEVQEKNADGSHFHLKMKKTWEKCLSATQSLDASIQYQMEEYAAVLCMEEFDHLLYPKRITNGLAYLYNYFSGKKPQYHHIKMSEIKTVTQEELFSNLNQVPKNKDRRHIHIAFRALLEHMDTLLASGELSDKAKRVFAEEAENVFMTHGLLGQGLENRVNYPENTIGLN
ncbi:hypothetical protein QBD27_14135 [Legionella pneumophila]|uniref:hypothetical protein n=1 Tax=Legionella pneumophila TaxID=446 RepID=UPI001A217244|nr:hypothetical protein [Legionella pneumophila]MDG5851999.1 hypothetical protein [Legionella pneumophila]HAT7841686.1 hypothetical protein [Legionella pneumophila]